MDFSEKEKLVKKSFSKLYERIRYLDQEIGKNEKEYVIAPPLILNTTENGITTFNIINDKPMKDTQIYIKLPGIILEYVYGAFLCEKHKKTYVYIYKDNEYTGTNPALVSEVLEKLEDFLNNNTKMIYSKIGKKIGNEYRNDAYGVKYTMIDFFDKKYIKEITIRNLDITMQDIYKLSTFKETQSISTYSCVFNDDVYLRFLSSHIFNDIGSKFKSLKAFDYANFNFLNLNGTSFIEDFDKSIKLNCEALRMMNIDIAYNLFFLRTDFHNVTSLIIGKEGEEYLLNPFEAQLLSCFYKAKAMDVNAFVKNYNFLYKLPYLENFNGVLRIIDDKELESTRRKKQKHIDKFIEKKPNFDIKRYLQYQRMVIELEKKKLYTKLIVPRIAETKWRAMIEDAIISDDLVGVRDKLLKIKQMPMAERQNIGTEDEVKFFDTDMTNSYKKLGIDLCLSDDECLLRDSRYVSNIIGPHGNKLYQELDFYHFRRLPIIGPRGREIAIVEYQQEHYDDIKEHQIKHIEENISSNNTLFDFYYNSSLNTDEKLECLEERLNNLMILSCNGRTTRDIKKRNMQKKVKKIIESKITHIFWNSSFLRITTENGKRVDDILLEEKTLDSIKEYFDKEKNEYHWSQEEVLFREKQLLEYLKLDDKEKRLLNIKPFISILNEYIESDESLKDVLPFIENTNVEGMFLNDITEFMNQFDFNETQKAFIKNYIFYLQESMQKNYENYLDRLEREEEALETDGFGSTLSWYSMFEEEKDKSLEQLYNEGTIGHNEYVKSSKYELIREEISKIRNTPKNIDIARVNKYYELMDIIDKLSTSDLAKLKETITITNEYVGRFDKFCDYLVYTITGDYPEWIMLELAKKQKAPKNLDNITHTTYISQYKRHRKGYSRLITNTFAL
jgi:hypothetical protein